MLIQKKNKASDSMHKQSYARLQASLFGIFGGLMVGVAGMRGGAVIIAGLFLLGLKDFQATATSTYVLVFMTATGALLHIAGGQVTTINDWCISRSNHCPQIGTTTGKNKDHKVYEASYWSVINIVRC